MTGIFLLLGTNLGDRMHNLSAARSQLEKSKITIKLSSSVYWTGAWGNIDQPAYFNQVLQVDTHLSAEDLLKNILRTEKDMGRTRQVKWEARIIDIDLLYYHQEIIKSSRLTVPHPQIPKRRFTLEPLCEIAPEYKHPKLGKTNRQLLDICDDPLPVKRIQSES